MIAVFAMIGLGLAIINFELDIIYLEGRFGNKNNFTDDDNKQKEKRRWNHDSTIGRYEQYNT